jgi:hypothetical protein
MSSRKLTKKDFEKMLNEKGDKLAGNFYTRFESIDLTGIDNYFECWKAQRSDTINQTGGEGVVFPGYGTWLRKNGKEQILNREFDVRYHNWIETHA